MGGMDAAISGMPKTIESPLRARPRYPDRGRHAKAASLIRERIDDRVKLIELDRVELPVKVGLIGRREQLLEDVASRIAADGGEALVLPCDIAQEDQVATAFARGEERWGGIDTCVGTAGIELWGEGDDRVDRLDLAIWQRIVDTNLKGMVLTLKYAVRSMLKAGGGAIVVTGSPTGLYGFALGEDAYSASKAGCHGLARIVANEVARDNIRVNIVVPGFIDTPINAKFMEHPTEVDAVNQTIPVRRPGKPGEIAPMNLWLCSDEASYVNGSYFFVDGGWMSV